VLRIKPNGDNMKRKKGDKKEKKKSFRVCTVFLIQACDPRNAYKKNIPRKNGKKKQEPRKTNIYIDI
jgi:hypothetical protein